MFGSGTGLGQVGMDEVPEVPWQVQEVGRR